AQDGAVRVVSQLPAHAMRASASVAVVCLAWACAHTAPGPTHALTDRGALRSLELRAVGPAPYRHHDLYGRVVLVSFFATWCFPCLAEIPTLKRLQTTYAPKGLSVVAVGLDLEGALVLEPFA